MLEAVRQFADPEMAHAFFVQVRWPNGVACPRMGCGSALVSYMPKHHRWYCGDCKGQFSAKVGTIFEDSPIGFDKWLPAIWLIASNRNGISSCELARALDVTQKTAWFMLHRIRLAAQAGVGSALKGAPEARLARRDRANGLGPEPYAKRLAPLALGRFVLLVAADKDPVVFDGHDPPFQALSSKPNGFDPIPWLDHIGTSCYRNGNSGCGIAGRKSLFSSMRSIRISRTDCPNQGSSRAKR